MWPSSLPALFRVLLPLVLLATSAVAQPPPPTVSVASPLQETIAEWDEFTGRFEASAAVDVRPRVGGFIDQIHFRDGQIVERDALLFTIDPRPYEIAVASAKADVDRAVAQVDLAAVDVRRGEPLAQTQALTQRELDSRRSALRVAQANRDSAIAALRNAELNLSWTEVRAPLAGRISNRRIDIGNVVEGGQGVATPTLLTTIVALDPIYFTFDAPEADYLKYVRLAQSGQRPSGRENPLPVQVRLQDEATWNYVGHMDFVDNAFNPRSGTIRARAVFDNPKHFLTPGVFGRMRLWAGNNPAILVPDEAIQSDQAKKIVLVAGPGDVVGSRVVTLGPIADGLRVIRTGLAPDDRVIITGLANPFVRPGMKVTPQAAVIRPAPES